MTVSREIRKLIEGGDWPALEDHWLARVDAADEDLAYFTGVGRALAGAGEQGRARLLLEILDEHLAAGARHAARLDLLQGVGPLLVEPEHLHPRILETLRLLYDSHPSLEGLMEKVGLHRAVDDVAKTWEKVARLRRLLDFETGSAVWMEGKGAGRVVAVNLELETFKVDFANHPGLQVGFAAAGKMLTALPAGHILRRKIERPEELADLAVSDPGALLLEILKSYDRGLTAGEIREILDDIVPADAWTSWWSAARRHPRILAISTGGRRTYGWAASGESALEAVREEFAAADLKGKLAIYRRDAGRDETLRREMASALAELAAATVDPAAAFEVWVHLERLGDAPEDAAWGPGRLLAAGADLPPLLASLADRTLRDRAYALLRERRDDWSAICAAMLPRETDPRLLDQLAETLERDADGTLDEIAGRILGHPRRHPAAFLWLAERPANRRRLETRNPLRLLQQLLGAWRHDEFTPFRGRLKGLFETGGPVPDLLSRLDEDQALQAEQDIRRAPLEDYLRTPLLNALHLRFPALRGAGAQPLYALRASIAAKRAELQHLLEEEIPANRRAIEEARALGDLRENFEYKAARQRHEYLAARTAALKGQLDRAEPIDPAAGDTAEARIGSRVELEDDAGEIRTLTLLGPWESDPERDIVSYESPIGQALLGKRPGEQVELAGRRYRVRDVQRCAEGLAAGGAAGSEKSSSSTSPST